MIRPTTVYAGHGIGAAAVLIDAPFKRAAQTPLPLLPYSAFFGDILRYSPSNGAGYDLNHSHSMVAGGLLEMSYTTRLTPLTSLMILPLMRAMSS